MQEWHKTLSGYWSAYLGRQLTHRDVQTMMRLADIAACPPGPATVLEAEAGQAAPRKFCDDAPVSYGPETAETPQARVQRVVRWLRDLDPIAHDPARRNPPDSMVWSRKDRE